MMIETYFSHSWKPEHIPLNILVWKTIAQECVLYVDHEGAESGAYYINRLEEFIRKSDVFVSVLLYRDDYSSEDRKLPDYQLRCLFPALFELRLAERARKPRWIIYDDRTGFVPMQEASDLLVYTPIDAEEELERRGPNIRADGMRWLKSISATLNTVGVSRSRQAALLIDDTRDGADLDVGIVQGALKEAGYGNVIRIETAHTDAEVVTVLQSSGLLVAEIGGISVRDIYGMAHAMFIPTIRFVRAKQSLEYLPRLLDGHPGGYQHDLIVVEDDIALQKEVRKRAEAMRDRRKPIDGLKAGCTYFRRKLYRKHNVFISHNISVDNADLLERLFEMLESRGICAWEYRHNNRAGVVWKDELQSALHEATDIVFILDNDFELSKACSDELRTIIGRREEIKCIIPFLWGKRTQPNPELESLHHEHLPTDKALAAQIITEKLVSELQASDG